MSSDRSPAVSDSAGVAATTLREPCERCGRETDHEVYVHVFVESADAENAAFSRQPYRVSVCTACGGETLRRMHGG